MSKSLAEPVVDKVREVGPGLSFSTAVFTPREPLSRAAATVLCVCGFLSQNEGLH